MNKYPVIENGVIKSTRLGFEESNGIFSSMLILGFDGGVSQGFGGLTLDNPTGDWSREGTAYGCEYIRRILTTLEVDEWGKLPGTPVRVFRPSPMVITKIGHFYKDKWFDPADFEYLLEDNYK